MSDENYLPNTAILETIKNLPLSLIFVVHFILITWGIQGYWSPDSYTFYNLFFMATLMWSFHNKESEEPVLMCLFINVLAILFDIIILCQYFPALGSHEKFSGAMAIFNLLLRPVSSFLLFKQYNARSNRTRTDPNFPGSSSAKNPRNYQDVEGQSYPGIDNLSTPYQ